MNFLQKILLYQGWKVRYWTAWTTTTTTLASQWGLLINIDSATGAAPTTATTGVTNPVEDEKFNIFIQSTWTNVGTSSWQFIAWVSWGTWGKIFRYWITWLTNVWATFCRCSNSSRPSAATINLDVLWKYCVPVLPNTKYKLVNRFDVKSFTAVWTTPWFACAVDTYTSAWAKVRTSAWSWVSYSAVTWWFITESIEFTTWATETFIQWIFYCISANGSIDIDYNAWKLDVVVEPVANSLTSSSPSLVSFTAVGSTDNIDQSFTTGTAWGVSIWNIAWTSYWGSQSFTPTKSKHTSATFYKKANTWTPTGNFKFDVRTNNAGDPSSTILATYTMPLATYNALSVWEFTVNLPCEVTAWTLYHYVFIDTVTEASGNAFTLGWHAAWGYTWWDSRYSINSWSSWVINGTLDLYFKTLYYKPTTNFKASQNNSTVSISADEDGFLDGSVINLTTGTLTIPDLIKTKWDWTTIDYSYQWNDLRKFTSYYSATNVNWFIWTSYNIVWPSSATNWTWYVFKIQSPATISSLTFTYTGNSTPWTSALRYSYDAISWTEFATTVHATEFNTVYSINKTTTLSGLSTNEIFIEIWNVSGWPRIWGMSVTWVINTSSLSTLRNYPTNKDIIKQYATTLSWPTTSATYRATKWGFPAIEYGSDTNIDQSQLIFSWASAFWWYLWVNYITSQSFTTTKSSHTWVTLYKRANTWTPTWNVKFDVRTDNAGDPSTTILATYTMPLATYNALTVNADFTVNLPCNLTPWTKYHYVITDTATETWTNIFNLWANSSWWYSGWDSRNSSDGGTTWVVDWTADIYFKTLYSTVEYQYLDVDTTASGSTVAFSEDWASYTTVADWASLAITSTTTPNIFVKANITANRLYLSSNDYSASSDKDWSLRQSVVYQVVQ